MDWGYINERLRRYNEQPSDDLLYRIGTHVDVIASGDGSLTSKERFEVFNWLECHGYSINHDLALLIFGKQQLSHWLAVSRQAYPHFEFYLAFEYQDKFKSGFDSGVNFTMHWHPQPGAPVPMSEEETDFPWRTYWVDGASFWGEFPGETTNHFEFNLYCYPDEMGFTRPGWICEEGDWYTMQDEQEASLMSVSEVLQHFTVQV